MSRPEPGEWLMKEDAAKFMKSTVRTIERLARTGRVQRRLLPRAANERQARVVFLRSDLEAVLNGGRSEPVPLPSAGLTVQQRDQLARAFAVRNGSLLPAAETHTTEAEARGRVAVAHSSRAWLTLSEAAEYSGLEAAFIAQRLRKSELEHIGQGPKSWRILRSSLDSWTPRTASFNGATQLAGGNG